MLSHREFEEVVGKYDLGIQDDCTKCSMTRNPMRYHGSCYDQDTEHLHYTCGRCGYTWTGPTVDHI